MHLLPTYFHLPVPVDESQDPDGRLRPDFRRRRRPVVVVRAVQVRRQVVVARIPRLRGSSRAPQQLELPARDEEVPGLRKGVAGGGGGVALLRTVSKVPGRGVWAMRYM